MNRIFFMVYSFDCSDRHPVFTPSGNSPKGEGQAGRHPRVVPLSPILPAFEQRFSVWRAESAF